MSKVQSNNVTYELHSLGWKAFQNLCITITSEVWGQTVQSFCDSHDGGRDGAFNGTWTSKGGFIFEGTFCVQCKFTAKPDKSLSLNDLSDELNKARQLASNGLADNYFLFTNARLTGASEEKIRKAFEAIVGVNRFSAYGSDRIAQIITESSRLRRLVPRVYGLGDLSQILDERAYAQAQEILSALGDDLAKFVITDSYQKSAKALGEHGFVLLLGEPACGKSTIAAALAVGAIDHWGCQAIRIRDADDFVKHSNPNEKQFFWIDDAFGATQIDWACTFAWSRTFPHIQAAIRRGAKVLFTSRDYIYQSARNHLKESALPVMKGSQVVINVQDISEQERLLILYNHIRLGTQPQSFKSQIKPYLAKVAVHSKFSPEIARRLGNPMFTKNLYVSESGLEDFVANPRELLLEIIRNLDNESRSALALIFMRAGTLLSPIEMTSKEKHAVAQLGGSLGGVTSALQALRDSLVINSFEDDHHMWKYKHPTIRDAFASLVASDLELLDIYLTGSPVDKLFGEISCGNVGIEGVKVIVPLDRYKLVIMRIASINSNNWHNRYLLHNFLSYRCTKEFIEYFIADNPLFIQGLSVRSYMYVVSDVNVIVRLYEFGLLPESERMRAVNAIRELAVEVPDSGFLDKKIQKIMTSEEFTDIRNDILIKLLPNLDKVVNEWRSNHNGSDDPEEYFNDLKEALKEFRNEFETEISATKQIDDALMKIDRTIVLLQSELPENTDENDFDDEISTTNKIDTRSIFEDVDQ